MQSTEELVKAALSANRLATYEQAKGITIPGLQRPLPLCQALELYAWNAQIAAAFMHPLHICEVVVRNGVSDALEAVYGANWPWSPGFLRSLPNPRVGYSMHKDLIAATRGNPTTGKVIPELKFVFWQKMFTSRYDARLWGPHLSRVFPKLPAGQPATGSRTALFVALEKIRALRNRIAHHEPIYARNLTEDFATIHDLIVWRSPETARWMNQHQEVTALLGKYPIR